MVTRRLHLHTEAWYHATAMLLGGTYEPSMHCIYMTQETHDKNAGRVNPDNPEQIDFLKSNTERMEWFGKYHNNEWEWPYEEPA